MTVAVIAVAGVVALLIGAIAVSTAGDSQRAHELAKLRAEQSHALALIEAQAAAAIMQKELAMVELRREELKAVTGYKASDGALAGYVSMYLPQLPPATFMKK